MDRNYHKIFISYSSKLSNGVTKMKPFAIFLLAILLLACLALPAAALESKVLTVSERTISADLGPSFEINRSALNTSDNGIASQDFLINNTASAGSAFISIMSVYDGVLGKMSPRSLSELFLIGGMSAVEARGDKETGNWTAVSALGKNVTVHTMSTKDERIQTIGGSYDMAVWDLNRSTYTVLVSLLDRDNTTQIIKTLAIS
jgi:hypothetical protein